MKKIVLHIKKAPPEKGRVKMDNDKEYFWQYKDLKKGIEAILKNYREDY